MKYHQRISGVNHTFDGLVDLMAKATPLLSLIHISEPTRQVR